MKTPALEALGRRYGLGEAQQHRLCSILTELEADDRAPTTVRDPARAVDVHIADSLVALELDVVRTARTLADLGAGAGFPGLPLAVGLPSARVRLLDSQERKCAFVEGLASRAEITNAEVVRSRVEEWDEGIAANDVVLARALAPPAVVLEYAAPLLKLGGTLVDWRGRRAADQDSLALAVAGVLGLERTEVRRTHPFEGARDHHLHLYTKVGDTPDRFPRRPGMARKRPLGPSDRDQR